MRQSTWSERLRYGFDNTMSRGTIALVGWLLLGTAILVLVGSLTMLVLGIGPHDADGNRQGLLDTLWFSLMRSMDAGAIAGDQGRWAYLFGGLAITFGGIFVFSTLIGILSTGIGLRLDELRKGRSFVVESDHTVILGWNSQIFSIVSELVIANASTSKGRIVILAEQDKVQMEDDLRARIADTGRTRIICRSGNPMDLADLEIVNPHQARSIIILSPEEGDPDSSVIKAILALTNNPRRRPAPYHIVAEIREQRNLDVAKMVARDEAQLILSGDLISRIAVQTSRQSGLSVVYSELLDFDGDEIYFQEEPSLVGRTFGDALHAYEDSTVIGLRHADGRVQLVPPMNTTIERGTRIIAVSADDNTVVPIGHAAAAVDEQAIRTPKTTPSAPERTVILGWNRRAPGIINELDNYVAAGSEILLVVDDATAEETIATECADLRNIRVTIESGDTTNRRLLNRLDLPSFPHVIVLGYSDQLGPQDADAKTLITLLHLRDIAERCEQQFSIVSEMQDIRNRELAEVTRADDFIVSDRLISLLLAQISENRDLAAVFEDLFDAEGVELYLKPIAGYVRTGQPVNFYTVVEAARRQGEVAIGYRRRSAIEDRSRGSGVVVNPRKSAMETFGEEDFVIVLAED